jgi:hypothetical protein
MVKLLLETMRIDVLSRYFFYNLPEAYWIFNGFLQ